MRGFHRPAEQLRERWLLMKHSTTYTYLLLRLARLGILFFF